MRLCLKTAGSSLDNATIALGLRDIDGAREEKG
jgi:hypothetical protein